MGLSAPFYLLVLLATPCPPEGEVAEAARQVIDANSANQDVVNGDHRLGGEAQFQTEARKTVAALERSSDAYEGLLGRVLTCAIAQRTEAMSQDGLSDGGRAPWCPSTEELNADQIALKALEGRIVPWGSPMALFEQNEALKKDARVRHDQLGGLNAACVQAHQQRVAEANRKTAAADQAIDRKLQTNKKAIQAAFSVNSCSVQQDETQALHAIKEEKEGSRIAGVQNLLILRQQQDIVVARRKQAKVYREALRQMKLSPLRCDDKVVGALWSCASEPDSENCAEPHVQGLIRLVATLAGPDPAE